jgi:hypothetical protein
VCEKNKLSIEEAKTEVIVAAIQDMLGIYHGIVLQGLEYTPNTTVINMIRLLKQKAKDKKDLAK